MAYTVTFGHNGKSAQYREYEIDTPDDLNTLPVQAEITAIGSLAHSRSNNTTYKLGNNREWYALTEGGGSELPESTAEDAGKVLTVGSTGAAEWAAASGGGGIFVIPYQHDETSDTYSTTITCGELKQALAANKVVCLVELRSGIDPKIGAAVTSYLTPFFPESARSITLESGAVLIETTEQDANPYAKNYNLNSDSGNPELVVLPDTDPLYIGFTVG